MSLESTTRVADELMSIGILVLMIDVSAHNKTAVSVFEYEQPVLEAIHGVENVNTVSSNEIEVEYFNAAEAHASLLRKYAQHKDAVQRIYRTPKDLSEDTGLDYAKGDDATAQFNGAVQYVGGKKVVSTASERRQSNRKTTGKKARTPRKAEAEAPSGDEPPE